MLLDFSRAFDCGHDKPLLSILEAYNFSTVVVKWIQNYMCRIIQLVGTRSGSLSECRSIFLHPQQATQKVNPDIRAGQLIELSSPYVEIFPNVIRNNSYLSVVSLKRQFD